MDAQQQALLDETIHNLENNDFRVQYFPTKSEAAEWIMEQVEPEMTVGFGGSLTLREMKLPELVQMKGATVAENCLTKMSSKDKRALLRKELLSDVFLTSANAISAEGSILSVDAAGNRVAAMIFGPERVIVVAGINKLVATSEEAKKRIEEVAAPGNNRRFKNSVPCVETGACVDCHAASRICRVFVEIKRRPTGSNFTVVLVGENLGL